MGFSSYTSTAILNAMFGKTSDFGALSNAPTLYAALSNTDPIASGVTEPSGNGYTRVATAVSDWAAAAGSSPVVLENANKVAFPECEDEWVDVSYFALMDAETSGNIIMSGQIIGPNKGNAITKSLTDGDSFTAAPGQFKAQLS